MVDPVLIDHRPRRTLAELSDLGKQVERGQILMAQHLDGLLAWPTSPPEFLALLRETHQRLLGDALPEIAGRFRRPGETVTFGGAGKHRREGEVGERIEEALGNLFVDTELAEFAADSPKQVSIACAKFLVTFFRIHPFVDGTGRTGRSLIALLCRLGNRFELRWASGGPAHRRRYIDALEYAHQRVPGSVYEERRGGYGPMLLANWIQPQLHGVPDVVDEAGPPELGPDLDE